MEYIIGSFLHFFSINRAPTTCPAMWGLPPRAGLLWMLICKDGKEGGKV